MPLYFRNIILYICGGINLETQLGIDIVRKEAWSKVTGAAKYTDDIVGHNAYIAKLLTSTLAHANIESIDSTGALAVSGVKAVVTGNDIDFLCGQVIRDRPPLAKEKVRYYGEPVAMVIADTEQHAKAAVSRITVKYQPLPVVNSIQQAIRENPVLVHEKSDSYKKEVEDVYPKANTNFCDHIKIRKGDMDKGWAEGEVTVEGSFHLPQSDHAAMETRAASCRIDPDGQVMIEASSQGPFAVKEIISQYMHIPMGDINVRVPFVGGGFGGKAAVFLEVLAAIASKAVGGRYVKITNTREEDMVTSPCHLGLEATIKLAAKKDGKITAAQMVFYVDCGGYAEIGPRMAKAIAVDCSGPYSIENIWCDSYGVYTNHPVATSFRGFGHAGHAFCLERMMDKLSKALNIDPFQIRYVNAANEGDFTATQAKITLSNTGNLGACMTKLKTLLNWDEGVRIEESSDLVRVKGIACLCKTSDSPTDAVSGVVVNFNKDGSINLNCGAVEIGPGMKTTAAQILAEKMRMSIDRIHVKMEVDTESSPKHWKTVASMTTFMAGRAVLQAAEDLVRQLLSLAGTAMRCPPEDLDYGDEKVFLKGDPGIYISFKNLAHGYKYPNGNAIEGQIIGHGSYIMNHITQLDQETGKGKAGPGWTLGAQGVEIEYNTKQHTYRFLKAATVIDAGKVLNPKTAKGVLMGGMCMGLGLAASEEFLYDRNGAVQNTSFRTYKMMRYGETPDYLIDFVETPQINAPYGARGLGEHGIIGIPAAAANALSLAIQDDIDRLPITPEYLWRKTTGNQP